MYFDKKRIVKYGKINEIKEGEIMSDVIQYKCPSCNGALEFDSKSQKMKCPYCDCEFEVETLKALDEQLKEDLNTSWNEEEKEAWSEEETSDMNVYQCSSCGGEVIGDATTSASSCPYCGNPVVMKAQFKGDLKPEFVIPFKLDKEAAKKALKAHYEGKVLLPKDFKTENHINEIKGMYVPVWLFDSHVSADIKYHGTKVRRYSDSEYDYTETRHFAIIRNGDLSFENIPVDGSTKIPDDYMESIEPFDFSEAVDFQTAYLAGYFADRYDVDEKASIKRANERIRKSTIDEFEKTIHGYASVRVDTCSLNLSENKAKYALYPVWMLNTKYQGQNYMFMMNGQTGKLTGNLPIDKAKSWLIFFIVFVIVLIGCSLGFMFFMK